MTTTTTRSTKNMTPAEARKVFTAAVRSMPSMTPERAKQIVSGAVQAARKAQTLKARRQQASQRFKESWNRGSGLER